MTAPIPPDEWEDCPRGCGYLGRKDYDKGWRTHFDYECPVNTPDELLDEQDDTAAAILAGLVETVRVMGQNAAAQGRPELVADYDHAREHLEAAAAYLSPFVADSHTDPIEKIAAQAAEEGGHREA